MTKSICAIVALVACVGFSHAGAAQTLPANDPPDTAETPAPPVSVFTQHTDRPLPVWAYEPGPSVSDVSPEVMERSINIALGLGVLGQEVRPYRVSLPGPGYVGVIPAPVPEGWLVIRRCMERSNPTAHYPLGECHVFEMREVLGNPHAIAWD